MSDASRPVEAHGAVDRELVFTAVHRARTPMLICDPRQADTPIILANQAFLALTGYQAHEVLGRNCRLLQGPQTDQQTVSAIAKAVQAAGDVEIEILNYRKDRSTFWNRVSISPVHDEAGRLLYFFGSQVDITEHRLARESQAENTRILLREIDHRALNALAIVEGVVRLTRTQDVKQYAAAVHRRVQTLARAHAFLAQSRWQAARLDEILWLLLGPRFAERTRLEGPELRVSATLVQPLALVIHELATNAETHGCLSSQAGRLFLSWKRLEAERGFCLSWEETGGPAPPKQRVAGFGAAMVPAIIERQLRGRTRLQWLESGLHVELVVPDSPSQSEPFQILADS